jgi:hypothetical protein
MSVIWNLWHGCIKISEGCKNCYVFRRDSLYGIDSKNVYKTRNFDLPLKRKRDKSYKIEPGEHVWTRFTSAPARKIMFHSLLSRPGRFL